MSVTHRERNRHVRNRHVCYALPHSHVIQWEKHMRSVTDMADSRRDADADVMQMQTRLLRSPALPLFRIFFIQFPNVYSILYTKHLSTHKFWMQHTTAHCNMQKDCMTSTAFALSHVFESSSYNSEYRQNIVSFIGLFCKRDL